MQLRKEWSETPTPRKKNFALKYGISVPALDKYLNMTEEDVDQVLEIKEYRKRHTDMDDYLNIIYKMLRDHFNPAFIYSYIIHIGYPGSLFSLEDHIRALSLNNFGVFYDKFFHTQKQYPENVTIISRNDVFRYITIKDKDKMNETDVYKYYSIIMF